MTVEIDRKRTDPAALEDGGPVDDAATSRPP
jgi:hypothetical protein